MAILSRSNPSRSTLLVRRPRKLLPWFVASVLGILLAFAALALQPDRASAQVGPSGVSCNASRGSGGLEPGEHSVTIGGRPALIYVGAGYSPSRPAMLTFYLHGDGAGTQGFLSTARRELLDNNGWIYVAPRARGDIWWSTGVSSSPSGNAGIEANAQLLEDTFEALFADYNLCRNVLLGSSASGGSWFYDGYFLPTRGDQYPAYMNVGCGSSGIDAGWSGFPFYSNLSTFNTNPEILARTKLHYSIGTADFLFPPAQQAIPHLEFLGFDVTTDFRDGVEHCRYDVDQTSVNWWADLCRDGFVPVTSMDSSGAVRPESCNAGQVSAQKCGGLLVTVDLSAGQQPTTGDDVILGTSGADVINALGGDDTVCGLAGDDMINGGNGNDRLFGGEGKDRIRGQNGDDLVNGQGGNDNLNGNNGDDEVNGGTGHDYVAGNDGFDTLTGGDGTDTVNGGGKSDVMRGGRGNDTLNGNGFADTIYGSTGNDIISGGDGPDKLFGENGNDVIDGNRGNDTISGSAGFDTCTGRTGFDTQTGCEVTNSIP